MAEEQSVELLTGALMQLQHQLQHAGCRGCLRAGGQPLFRADLIRQPTPPSVIAFGFSGLQLPGIDRLQFQLHPLR